MSSTKSQVAVATNIQNHTAPLSSASTSSAAANTATSHSQRDYNNDESLGRQSSFGNNRRGNPKGKHLTRSHAMRESTSPPRTPTPRAEHAQHVSPNGHSSTYQQHPLQQHQSHHHSHHHHHHAQQQQHHQQQQQQQIYSADGIENYGPNNNNNNNNNNNKTNNNNNNNNGNKLHAQTNNTRGTSPIIEAPSVIITSQSQQQQQQQQNVPLANEAEFPKLTPPKSTKNGSGGGGATCSATGSSGNGNGSGINNTNGTNGQRISGINSNNTNNNNNNTNDTNNKSESNNNGNNNCNGTTKKIISSDFKYGNNSNASGSSVTVSEAQKNSNLKQQTQQHLNLAENSNNARCQAQAQAQATAPAPYNSGMNYNAPSTSETHQSMSYEKEHRNLRHDSHNSSNALNDDDSQHRHYQQQQQPQHHHHHSQQQQHYYERERSGGGGGGGNKKHRASSSSKGPKPRLKNMGSSGGSVEGGVFNNPENSGEYTDNGGTDLITFFRETLNNKNIKDRHLLLKIEKDLIELIQDKTRSELRFPSASSYNRMLIHRTAAYFGMEHNVDAETQQCVIVAATKGTRIPDVRFKSLVRDSREDSRKSILKRDTHSFDEARQSSYLCPDRGGMLDRKAKSFEEREEDYERARSRIFNRSQHDPNAGACGGVGGSDRDEHYMSWASSMEQQQQQQQQHQHHLSQQQQSSSNRGRSNGKLLKMQTSTERERGAVPKTHNYGSYVGPGSSQNCGGGNATGSSGSGNGGPPLLRGDSAGSNKSGASGSRNYGKQDFSSGTNSWRLSPSNNGSIYHFDPSHLPPNSGVNNNNHSGSYHSNQATLHQQQAPNQDFYPKKNVNPNVVAQQNQQEHTNSNSQPLPSSQQHQNDVSTTIPTYNTAANQTSPTDAETMGIDSMPLKIADETDEADESQDSSSFKSNEPATGEAISDEETPTKSGADECDNTATGCLSITTTTSTKNYDRIEVQKFKNQATSPNIPSEKEENVPGESSLPPEPLAQIESSSSTRNQLPNASQTPTTSTQAQLQPQGQSQQQQSQDQTQQQQLQQSETPQSSRSTPYSGGNDSHTKRASEEPRPQTWTYTQSYQAADGSTVFHTANTPNSNPYCTTTYQQGPDGSVYAIPQSMVYAYPQQDSEVQGYFMPVYDTAATNASIVPAGAQAVFPSAPAGATTMVPMAAAYPTTQFATANGAPIFQGQVIYPSEQQQIPMTTYPAISYPYPYNGYWGQTMTYYVPTQQAALANTIPAAHLLATPPQAGAPQPGTSATTLAAAQHVTGGVNLGGGILATPTMPGSSAGLSGGGNSTTALAPMAGGSMNNGTFNVHGGTTYGTGRIKRPTAPHYGLQQTGAPHVMAGMPALQQFTQTALSTLTLTPGSTVATAAAAAAAAAANAAANELNTNGGTSTGTAMYAVPQHATVYSANIYPYAASATPTGVVNTAAAANNPPLTPSGSTLGNTQSTNQMLAPYYAHRPQVHTHTVPVTPIGNTGHTPGPAAIPIVDPATLNSISSGSNSTRASSNNSNSGASHSAPTTPLSQSQSSQVTSRNPPLFSTPPIMSSASYSTSSTPQCYAASGFTEQPTGSLMVNSQQNVYVTTSTYEKRSGKKPTAYASGNNNANSNRQNSNNTASSYAVGKPPIYGSNTENRSSPNSNARAHNKGKGNGNGSAEKTQAPLLSAPPPNSFMPNSAGNLVATHSYSPHYPVESSASNGKPPIRLNAAAASFRQKSSGIEFRRSLSLSQRNSPGTTNSSSNDNSSNNSPSSISNAAPIYAPTASGAAAITSYGNSNSNSLPPTTGNGNNLEQQQQQYQHSHQQISPSVFIATTAARTTHIPGSQAQMQHSSGGGGGSGNGPLAATLGGSTNAAIVAGSHASAVTVLNSTATTVEVASTAAHHHHHHHHQPLLGTYNPGAAATGVYFKYGQTYLAHPTVSLQNSRRSPSTDLRPPMAQMAGMYPTLNMAMIPAPPRHTQGGRHPNPNYKGSRPR